MIFLADWFYFLIKSDKKISYAFTHIFDLISAIPFIPGLRFLRILRIFRFVRGFRGIVSLLTFFKKRPMESALLYYSIFVILVSFYCTLGFYKYELPLNKDLKSFGDVLWLTFTTMTAISYGDVHPVTTEGRLITMVLVVTGAVFFALLSGEIATLLIRQSGKV